MRALYDDDLNQNIDFKARIRGGPATFAKKGTCMDRFECEYASGWARIFLHKYRLQRVASFTIKLYGWQGCRVLAEEWCRKMQHFYTVYNSKRNGNNYVFTVTDIGSYEESRAFTNLFNMSKGRIHQRCIALRILVPTGDGTL